MLITPEIIFWKIKNNTEHESKSLMFITTMLVDMYNNNITTYNLMYVCMLYDVDVCEHFVFS